MEDSGKLTHKEMQVVNAVLTSKTLREASEKAGVSESTLYRYLKKEHIQKALDRKSREAMGSVLRYFVSLGTKALGNIEQLLDSKYERIRLEASKYILDMIVKIKELQELEERIESLERIVQEQKGGNHVWD